MILCKVLLGRPLRVAARTGQSLQEGYTSHFSDEHGTEIVIFDEAAILPMFVVNLSNGRPVAQALF